MSGNRSIFDGRMTERAIAGVPRRGAAHSCRSNGTDASARSRTCRRPDCQLAAKGAANVAIEASYQERSKPAERVLQTAPISVVTTRYKSRLLNRDSHLPEDDHHRRRRSVRRQTDRTKGLSQYRTAARRALFTVFAVRSAADRPPCERANPRANAGRHQATPSYARRLSSLVKCPLSDTEPRPATPGT